MRPLRAFGLAKNPFNVVIRRIEAIDDPAKKVMMRNRCCLYYRIEGGQYCYNCPRLKEAERAERRTEYRKQAAASDSH
ncbi:(2Fe-2S)-binding protein [Paenibacillus donghaensis]|uniref:Ferric siderophore reductase C-terminal domain-containing protein n=1 Tax=Paenibacillus donghaensis TaxID=414771 RepID=A0A2Z2KRU2_9BACL|nr:(2Fe-2S)-binding protein [Paenibacillus donghaensis]ASA21748.1 hypothetical protein B9T62_13805 [Paenibacillus donghaensis]